jgi:hypothetical protein
MLNTAQLALNHKGSWPVRMVGEKTAEEKRLFSTEDKLGVRCGRGENNSKGRRRRGPRLS